jgi:hypothetical protein
MPTGAIGIVALLRMAPNEHWAEYSGQLLGLCKGSAATMSLRAGICGARPATLRGLRREAGDGVAEVGAVEGGVLVDLAGEVALAQRAEGNEADAERFERGEDFRFRFPPA